MVALLTKGIQELKTEKDAEIDALFQRISALEQGQQAIVHNAAQPMAGQATANAPSASELTKLKAQISAQGRAIARLTTQRDALAGEIAALKEAAAYPADTHPALKILTLLVLAAVALLSVPYLRARAGRQS